jgi:hypothetical protein
MSRQQRPAGKPDKVSGRSSLSGRADPQVRGRDHVRLAIAHAAAKLVAEGLTDYHAAKQKAARQLGVTDSHALPDNHDIESALREHFLLFAQASQPVALAELRAAALRLMERLDQFSPWLVGPVLTGTANEFSEIELELVGVEAKDFEHYLLNRRVDFMLSESRATHKGLVKGAAVCYQVEFEDIPARITLYPSHAARQAARPRDGIKQDRAERNEAIRRFSIQDNNLEHWRAYSGKSG